MNRTRLERFATVGLDIFALVLHLHAIMRSLVPPSVSLSALQFFQKNLLFLDLFPDSLYYLF